MPVHDWTRVISGIFHHFHQRWIGAIADALNDGMLPAEYYALSEQQTDGPVPDILTLERNLDSQSWTGVGSAIRDAVPGGVAVAERVVIAKPANISPFLTTDRLNAYKPCARDFRSEPSSCRR